MGNITLQTIAERLGVSRTTVSNAFNRPDQLSDELRDRILTLSRQLGYTGPDPAARNLRMGRSGALGVVLTESLAYAFENPYSLELLAGVAGVTEAARQGLYLIPCPPGVDQVSGVRDAAVDGFCVFTLPDDHPVVHAVISRDLPTVFVDGPLLEDHSFVGIDDREAMREVTGQLLELGHRHVTIISFRLLADDRVGEVDALRLQSADYRVTRERLHGAIDAMADFGVEPLIYEIGEDLRDGARRAVRRLLSLENPPTAIVGLSDQIALGALDAAEDAGLDVPGQLSLTGFDGTDQAHAVGLATVDQPARDKGRKAVELLTGDKAEHFLLPYLFVPGRTMAPPPSSRIAQTQSGPPPNPR